MLKIGDVVTPEKMFLGHGYCFEIVERKVDVLGNHIYKLENLEQDLLKTQTPNSYQCNVIRTVEQRYWEERDLKFIGSTTNVEKITFSEPENLEIKYFCPSFEETITNLTNNIDKLEGDNNMKNILDVYKERKKQNINKKYDNLIQEIKDSDKIQEIMQDTNRLIQEIEPDRKFSKVVFNAYTSETEEDISDMEKARDIEIADLNNLIEEVEAYFTMTTDFSERKEILKNYSIIDKKGKLNI